MVDSHDGIVAIVPKVTQHAEQSAVHSKRARFDGADRDFQPICYFRMAETEEVLQPNEFAIIGRQGVDRVPDFPHLVDLLGRGWWADQRGVGRVKAVLGLMTSGPAIDVDRCPPRDGSEPRPERPGRVIAIGGSEYSQR